MPLWSSTGSPSFRCVLKATVIDNACAAQEIVLHRSGVRRLLHIPAHGFFDEGLSELCLGMHGYGLSLSVAGTLQSAVVIV